MPIECKQGNRATGETPMSLGSLGMEGAESPSLIRNLGGSGSHHR